MSPQSNIEVTDMPCQCASAEAHVRPTDSASCECASAGDSAAACGCGSTESPTASEVDSNLARVVMELDKRVRTLEARG
jgi:hypothetical protein